MSQISFPVRLQVNSTDLQLAIREGCRPMQSLLDPSRNYAPYFGNVMSGNDPCQSHARHYTAGHVPGRWLNALLNAESALGIEMDEEVVAHLARWTFEATNHSSGLARSLDPDSFEWLPEIDLHNLRETMHALYSLVCFRGDQRALEAAKRMIATVDEYFDYETGTWNEERFQAEHGAITVRSCGEQLPASFGRYIGSLVKLYRACKLPSALQQAIRLKDTLLKHVFTADGEFDSERFGGHTHSTTSTMSSLAQLAETLKDESLLERVRIFMDNGLQSIAMPTGWCIEGNAREDHYGELNNTSDIMETCLILGRMGYPAYFQRAERVLRGYFLPSQLLDVSFVPNEDRPEDDSRHRLASRSKGAFGFACPYGHEYEIGSWMSFNWDIVGGAVGGLCEAWRDKVSVMDGGLISVNMLFEHDDGNFAVRGPYAVEGEERIEITARSACSFRIRMSDWVRKDRLRVTVNGEEAEFLLSGHWLYMMDMSPNSRIAVAFPLEIARAIYEFRGETFEYEWMGDAVRAMDTKGRRLCFFDPISPAADETEPVLEEGK